MHTHFNPALRAGKSLGLACLAALFMTAAWADGDRDDSRAILQVSKMEAVADSSPVAGAVLLERRENSFHASVHTTQLAPLHAYTIWWLINAHPEKCASDPCTGPDLFNPATGTSAFYGGGFVSGADGVGNASFSLESGKLPDGVQVLNFGTGVPAGLPREAGFHVQLKVVIRTSGVVSAATADAQLSQHLNCATCDDQFAVFEAPKLAR